MPDRQDSRLTRNAIRRSLNQVAGFRLVQAAVLPAPPYSLGRLALTLLAWLLVSGILLTIPYEPTAAGAWQSIISLQSESLLMAVIRDSHRWSAIFLLIVTLLHALRNLLVGGHRAPRHLTWTSGLTLLAALIMMAGNGYLLRWDIRALALYSLMTKILRAVASFGGPITKWILPDQPTVPISLDLGYALHTWILPVVLLAGLALHLAFVARHGLLKSRAGRARGEVGDRWVRVKQFLPPAALLAFVVVLEVLLPTQIGSSDPFEQQAGPNPDWLLLLYYAPFSMGDDLSFTGTGVSFLAALGLLALGLPWLDRQKRRSWLSVMVVGAVLVLVTAFLVQTARLGQGTQLAGCPACHNDRMEGGAPVFSSDLEQSDPAWLLFHMKAPVESILTPLDPTD